MDTSGKSVLNLRNLSSLKVIHSKSEPRKKAVKISTDVSENGTPNVNYSWNGRMVGKQKSSTQALRTVTIGKSWVQRLDTAIANINAVSLNFWLIKLVKEQCLIFLQ